ncbi:uncharacterized protein LOC116288408 [Actinia tenebrosa]|uniref:Uncharacterized protein LOC116288408 n=1 Tax=Actinia tenebrosa TaxID=6105 RepID=A0A6P8HEP9_ACTTE|nr:uncharacterized protein LOC116288408 [Actinia tenebrosa]
MSCVPLCLKKAVVTLLLKKPHLDHEIISNFRPVSNLTFLSKVIDGINKQKIISPFLQQESGGKEECSKELNKNSLTNTLKEYGVGEEFSELMPVNRTILVTPCPHVDLVGMLWHWTQALWRKVQALGLATAYKKDDGTYKFVRRLMALPFLPSSEITRIFIRLLPEATTEGLQALTGYIRDNWIESTVFPPENWSTYGQVVSTNNGLEGYHNALNCRASGKVHFPFYMLGQYLYKEANLVGLQIKLVSEEKLKRIKRKKYCNLQWKV